MNSSASTYRDISFWFDSLTEPLLPRPALPGDITTDIAIVGAGLTGLWTAYYLAKADPTLRIVVLEKHIAGYGASGRNGGWCSALFPASTASMHRINGRAAALAMRQAMIDTVDEVGRITALENIDCDFVKGGTLSFARGAVQVEAALTEVSEAASFGIDSISLRDSAGFGIEGALAATFDPACARLHPAKLVRGLATVVESLGVQIFEHTEVIEWAPHRVSTTRGRVAAETIVIATEGYGAAIPQTKRSILPLYSLMIATEPLSDAVWQRIGIEHGQTFSDFRHLLVYGQRTADNRIAFGGRGARYHWGSSIRDSYDRVPRVFEHLATTLFDMIPDASGSAITHRWGGALGVPRDWYASACFDAETGIASAGGYVGDGLSTTNLAGRTLTDLILRRQTTLTSLPWAGHRSPEWEPEPLRFIGANLGLSAMSFADVEERRTGRASLAAKFMAPLVGH